MRKILLLIAFICATNSLFSNIIIDFREVNYDEAQAYLEGMDMDGINGVVISHPFKRLGNTDLIFNPYDTGNIFEQGKLESAYGTLDELSLLADYCRNNDITVFSEAEIFIQEEGYHLGFWDNEDFYMESLLYFSNYLLVDIEEGNGASKMNDMINQMLEIDVDRWIIDLSRIPSDKIENYQKFVDSHFGDGNYLLLGPEELLNIKKFDEATLISDDFYWTLRQDVFMMPLVDLNPLTNELELPEYIISVGSDDVSINNAVTTLFLLTENSSIILPYEFFENDYLMEIIGFLNQENDFDLYLITDEMMIFHQEGRVVTFNLSDDIAMIQTENIISHSGLYTGEIGGSLIYSDGDTNYFFVLPRSVNIWDMD